MKKILLFIILFPCIANATNYCSGDAKACWLFTEGTGTIVADSTGNGNTGTFLSSGHPPWENSSLPSRSYIKWASGLWDGSTDQINVGTTSNLFPTNSTAWSMVGWVYVNTSSNPLRIIDKSSAGNGPCVNYNASTPVNALTFQVKGSANLNVITNINTFSVAAWHHIAVTWDGSVTATNVHIYIDGAEPSYLTQTNGATITDNSTQKFLIGSRNQDNTRVWNGYITELAVWNRVLSSSEVTDIYNNGLGAYSTSHSDIIQGGSIIRGGSIIN